jgi:hypothetical protein
MEGVTSIDDLISQKQQGNTDESMVESILQEINTQRTQPPQQQVVSQPNSQPQEPQESQQSQQVQQMHIQLQHQQQALENLSRSNKEKDNLLENIHNEKNNPQQDLFTEMKPSIIVFSVVVLLTLPVLNKFLCQNLGIEENAIFSILKTFIITIIFFLLNKFI